MKKYQSLVFFCLIFLISFGIWKIFLGGENPLTSAVSPAAVVNVQPSSIPIPSPKEIFDIPSSITIPKLDITADSESVGMDKVGRMDVPKNVVNVAWYKLGVKPGEKGNSVFAGHYDKPDGSPSVFYKLGTLKKGDIVLVTDNSGQNLEFVVTEKRVVKTDQFPLQEVFGETDKIRVNLITCGGEWDKDKKEYSQRTIVFTELKQN
jgi:LPXTG-site transpeptidase (sortase) family protein